MNKNKHTDPEEEKDLLIDIEQVFKSKNPALLKMIPGFVIKYLKHITHQDGINQFIHNNRDKKGLEFSKAILDNFGVQYNTKGLDKIPENGRYLFASNHPLGGMDGIALISAVGNKFPHLKFPVNDILMNIKGLNNIFLPINKHGSNPREAAIALNEAYASDAQILMFPAGLVSRKQNNEIKDLVWKKNFVKKAIEFNRDIIPVHITGRNTNFFYNLANWRKRFRIKANIEMLYLADEFFKQKGENLSIIFGSPVPCEKIKNEGSISTWTEKIREMVYQLPKNN